MDDENVDFRISGVPNAMVKRSQSISVHNLIQKIESHPQQEAIQNDLQQHQPFNPFSAESKVAIMAAGNTELCEIINVEPKLQCKTCLEHCSAGIMYCTCGHLMTDDSAENKKYISSVLVLCSIPNFQTRKAGHTVTSSGRNLMQRIPCGESTYKEMSQKEVWQYPRPIHPRQDIQEGDDWSGTLWKDHQRDGSACKWRPHSRCHQSRNWRIPWQLVIHSNVANFNSVPRRHQPDFKKALSTMYRQARTRSNMQDGDEVLPLLRGNGKQIGGVRLRPQILYDHWLNGVTRYLVANCSFAEWVSTRIEFKIFIVNISVTADGNL